MADNTDEEHLDNPTNIQPENLSDKIIPTKDTQSINLNQEPVNMEIHAHDLHKAPGHGWKHYFFEFLMLFLAVFCGFLAENFREHQIEKVREKEYMVSMVEDLVSDTAMLQSSIKRATAMERVLDSLKNNLYEVDNVEKNVLGIYRQNAEVTERLIVVSFSDKTTTQLRNAGGMRLIRKIKISNAISGYWRSIENVEFTLNNFKALAIDRADFANALFNNKYSIRLSTDSLTSLDNYFISPDARLMIIDKNQLINYANRTGRLQSYIGRFILRQLTSQKSQAIKLIDLIKKEYHFE